MSMYIASQLSWSPNIDTPDSTSSPNAYPGPPPSPHPPPRHPEPFQADSWRPPLAVDRPPPRYSHHRSPADVHWKADAQRRGFLLMRAEDSYFSPRGRGDPPYPHQSNHLRSNRDPRLRRTQTQCSTQPPRGASSPQSEHQSERVHTNSPRPSNAKKLGQILSEHSYFKKGEPGVGSDAVNSNAPAIDQSQHESQSGSCGLPRHMLSQVPSAITIIMKTPMSPNKVRNLLRSTEGIPEVLESIGKLMNVDISKAGMKEESLIKTDSSRAVNETLPDSTSKISPDSLISGKLLSAEFIKKENSPKEERDSEMVPDQSPQKETPPTDSISSPESPALSLSSFEIDLDTEPESIDEGEDNTEDEEEEGGLCRESPPCENVIRGDIISHLAAVRSSPPEVIAKKRKMAGESVTQQAEPVKLGRCNNRVLRNGTVLPRSTTSVVYSTRNQPVAVVDNKVPSVRLSIARDGFSSHLKAEDDDKQVSESQNQVPQARTRRSKRLATTQDGGGVELVNSVSEHSTEASNAEDGRTDKGAMDVRETAGTKPKAELTRDERMRMNLAAARAVKAEKERKRARLAEAAMQRTTRAVSLNDFVYGCQGHSNLVYKMQCTINFRLI